MWKHKVHGNAGNILVERGPSLFVTVVTEFLHLIVVCGNIFTQREDTGAGAREGHDKLYQWDYITVNNCTH